MIRLNVFKSKLLSVCTAIALSASLLNVTVSFAAETSSDVFKYEKNSTGITITGTTADSDEIIIPEEIDGLTVNEIASNAFYRNSSIKEVSIPDTVTAIGYGAFALCDKLAKISIPETVEEISYGSFFRTPWINAQTDDFIIAGNGILILYNGNDTEITVPDTVKKIGRDAFNENPDIVSVTISDSTTQICEQAFSSCKALASVSFGKSLTSIGKYAFFNCISLEKVFIPKHIKTIEENAFGYYFDDKTNNYTKLDDFEIEAYAKSVAAEYAKANDFKLTKSKEELVLGDLSGDGKLALDDIVLLKKGLLKVIVLDEVQLEAADLDNNGKINVFDLIILQGLFL